ncbi:class I SAM-dependent methyltransferase [Mesorhizobium sp. YR577]|uniref:class I SAM-dependent methyltransferase n=1 Tax=Mesorhizobium sp. YR577 TaxID=1884373 RepID=UPI0008ED54EF|nr:class I SAM-dependent methyltransferase [Mesorhizobium sp. YR577]SFT49444.1 pimeloyl-CoA biosynthesis protein BioC [Mesorhizobium sp. YR577]
MAQNIYDKSEFFAGYSQLNRSVHGLDGAPEWPSIRAVLPDLLGKRVVDLGCGFGWFSRWAREHGAAHVLGLDLSENMIARARADTADPNIEYAIADLEKLELPQASFDFAYSSLAFHYIEDFGRLVQTVHRALVPGSHFVFTIEHPIFMAPAHPGWSLDDDGNRTWPVNRYAVEGPRETDWFAKGVIKQHRTIGTTLNTLIGAGFAIRHVEEWSPASGQLAANPDLTDEMERPMMLLVAAQR